MLKQNIRIKPKPNTLRNSTAILDAKPNVFGADLKALGITSPQTQYVPRKTAAQILGQQPQTLAVWACTNRYKLPVYKVGRRTMYLVADLLRLLEESKR